MLLLLYFFSEEFSVPVSTSYALLQGLCAHSEHYQALWTSLGLKNMTNYFVPVAVGLQQEGRHKLLQANHILFCLSQFKVDPNHTTFGRALEQYGFDASWKDQYWRTSLYSTAEYISDCIRNGKTSKGTFKTKQN